MKPGTIVASYGDFIVKKVENGFIVKRRNSTYEQHAHFRSHSSAKNFARTMYNGIMPTSKWFKSSARRLLTEDEYKELRKCKCRNKPKVRKRMI